MSEIMKLDSKKAQLQPEEVFQRPQEIVESEGLTRAQKIASLERWAQSLKDKLRATSEGMQPAASKTAAEANTVSEIGKAINSLRENLQAK